VILVQPKPELARAVMRADGDGSAVGVGGDAGAAVVEAAVVDVDAAGAGGPPAAAHAAVAGPALPGAASAVRLSSLPAAPVAMIREPGSLELA